MYELAHMNDYVVGSLLALVGFDEEKVFVSR